MITTLFKLICKLNVLMQCQGPISTFGKQRNAKKNGNTFLFEATVKLYILAAI